MVTKGDLTGAVFNWESRKIQFKLLFPRYVLFFIIRSLISYKFNHTSDKQSRTAAIRECDLLITCMITDRIRPHEVLLPINQIMTNLRKKPDISCNVSPKKRWLTRRTARQQRAHLTRSVHLHRRDVLTVPLTVILLWRLHCPISAQIKLVVANHV